jgi:anti-anti-sigma factor
MAPAKHGHIGKMEFRDGVTIVRLQGNITFDTLHGIRHEHEQRFKGIKVKNIIADFKNISEIDTAAIVALVDRLKEMRSEYSKGAIGLINLPPKLRTLLEISKTKELFTEYGSEEEALVSLA